VDRYDGRQALSGTLFDLYPVGPVSSLVGAKTLISWDRLADHEPIED
jgi:hypothetical protein